MQEEDIDLKGCFGSPSIYNQDESVCCECEFKKECGFRVEEIMPLYRKIILGEKE